MFLMVFSVVCTVFTCREFHLTLVDRILWKFDMLLLYIIVFNEVLFCTSPMGRYFW